MLLHFDFVFSFGLAMLLLHLLAYFWTVLQFYSQCFLLPLQIFVFTRGVSILFHSLLVSVFRLGLPRSLRFIFLLLQFDLFTVLLNQLLEVRLLALFFLALVYTLEDVAKFFLYLQNESALLGFFLPVVDRWKVSCCLAMLVAAFGHGEPRQFEI